MKLYEILTLIITGLGVVATFSAVFVALWQTTYSNKKKLKCTFIKNNTVYSQHSGEHKEYVSMTIVNIGNKKLNINSWGIKTKDSFIMILTYGFETDMFDKAVSVQTPYLLEPESNITFYYEEKLFKNLIKEQVEKSKININKKLNLRVIDSSGKIYKVKSKEKASAFIK